MNRLTVIASAALVSGLSLAAAQAEAAGTPSNIPGVSLVALPPAGFDANSASASAVSQFAVPPAPSAKNAPTAFARWQKAVAEPLKSARGAPQNAASPVLEKTALFNSPNAKLGTMGQLTNNVVTGTSNNWSGASVVNGTFSTLEAIIGEFVVPTAHQAIGACTGGWDYSSQWPGIDGNGSSDVLQAGAEVDAYCKSGTTSSLYSAWIEWYPYSETRVSSPAIHPGDLLYVEVWSTSTTAGYAYFYNYSTGQSAEYALSAPSGTSLKGNSVEWIVERPGISGGLATLTNYVDTAWPYGVAWNYKASSPTYYYEGATPSAGTLELLTMLDNNKNGISSATVENSDFLFFKDFGSAY